MTYSHGRRIEPTLEEELGGLLRAAKLQDRQARAVAARLGWDGKGVCTLAVAAASEGYSRERVRQLEERVRTHARDVEAPVQIDPQSALRLVEELAPIPTDEIGFYLASGRRVAPPVRRLGTPVGRRDPRDSITVSSRRRDAPLRGAGGMRRIDGDYHLKVLVESMSRAGCTERRSWRPSDAPATRPTIRAGGETIRLGRRRRRG